MGCKGQIQDRVRRQTFLGVSSCNLGRGARITPSRAASHHSVTPKTVRQRAPEGGEHLPNTTRQHLRGSVRQRQGDGGGRVLVALEQPCDAGGGQVPQEARGPSVGREPSQGRCWGGRGRLLSSVLRVFVICLVFHP